MPPLGNLPSEPGQALTEERAAGDEKAALPRAGGRQGASDKERAALRSAAESRVRGVQLHGVIQPYDYGGGVGDLDSCSEQRTSPRTTAGTGATPSSRGTIAENYLTPFIDAKLVHLIAASRPTPLGAGQYSVRLRRASVRQPFGLSLRAADGAVFFTQETSHLGIDRRDILLKVNGHHITDADHCKAILAQELRVELLVQRPNASAQEDVAHAPRGWFFNMCNPLCDDDRGQVVQFLDGRTQRAWRVLLSATRPQVFDYASGEFGLMLIRTSARQRFGISFCTTSDAWDGEVTPIQIAEDMPHIGLRKGDVLLEVNGLARLTAAEVSDILESSARVVLRLIRRGGVGMLQAAFVEAIEDTMLDDDLPPRSDGGSAAGGGGSRAGSHFNSRLCPPSSIQVAPWRSVLGTEEVIEFCTDEGGLAVSAAEGVVRIVERERGPRLAEVAAGR